MKKVVYAFMEALPELDSSITQKQVDVCIKVLEGCSVFACLSDVEKTTIGSARVISRDKAAELMGCSPKRIDDLSRIGILRRVYYPGNSRASGLLASSVLDAIYNYRSADEAAEAWNRRAQ